VTTETEQQTPLEFALHYAAHGLHVFPCNPDGGPRKGTPIGGVKDAEGRGGFYAATTDAEQIRDWWTRYPDAAIGWRLAADGFVAVDLDRKNGKDGVAKWADLLGDDAPGTDLVADTPSSGMHLVFRTDDPAAFRSVSGEDGVDVRGDGGYLVIPNGQGSRAWRNLGFPFDQVGELDGKVRAEVLARAATDPALRRKDKPAKVRNLELYQDAPTLFVEVEDALSSISPSCDRTTWLECIYAVHDALHGSAEGAALVEDWSSRSGVEGQYKPGEARKVYADASAGEVRKGTLFHHAKQHGWRPLATGHQVTLGPNLQNTTPDVGGVLGGPALSLGGVPPYAAQRRRIVLRDDDEIEGMPVPVWHVLKVLPHASIALLVGDTMAGKTFVALDLALRLKYGMEFMGHVARPCSTLYLPGEGVGGLTSRVRGWKQQHNVDPADAEDRYVLFGDEVPELGSDPHAAAAAIREVIEDAKRLKGHAPGLVIVDTLSQAMTADENDATATRAIMRVLSDLRRDYGCTVLIVHHTRKQQPTNRERGTRSVNLDDARGSSTLTRNADAVLGITATDDPTAFELLALKQKDGSGGFLARFSRTLVHTDRTGEFGESETTCILVQEDRPIGERLTREERKSQEITAKLEANIARIVAALSKPGPDGRTIRIGSRDAVAAAAGMKVTSGRDAIRNAIARGLVVDSGTIKAPSFHLPEPGDVHGVLSVPDDVPKGGTSGRPGDAGKVPDPAGDRVNVPKTGGGDTPHTPRDVGTSSAEADPPEPERPTTEGRRRDAVGTSGRPSEEQAVQIPRPEPELVDPEDQGRPRKPGGTRRRSKR